jgi:hypothetical protein
MPLGIEEILRPALRDRGVRFVFPSEICAESWLAEALRMGVGAIEADRFLGWDKLKEAAAREDGRPASDDYLRKIFSASLLAENAASPFLASILPPAYADLWQPFAGYLASRLPALARLPSALRAVGRSSSRDGDPAAADWMEVRRRYEAFLGGIGRFEPSYEPHSLRALEGRTIVFFPELIEDFEEYRSALEAAPSVRLVGLPAAGSTERVPLRRPETALAELRQTLAEVGELLDSGLEAERIAITVANLSRYRPYLEREATLLSVPIALRSGESLASTSGGRLFVAMRDACSSGFSYDALRDLALSPAWPWADPSFGRGMMAAGLRLHALASWSEKGKPVDAWERSLGGSLLSDYRRLKSRITAIASASDFKQLLKSYNSFKAEFLSPEREDWEPGADLTLARCVVELQGLARAQAQSGLEVQGAFGLFMRALDSKPYVGAGASGGVPVYEWRVAAGICPDRHFILDASQDALSLPSRGFDYLGEALRKELNAALRADEARDSAPAFIAAYAQSGASVSFSCPQTGFGGDLAAHGFLVSMSREEEEKEKGPRDDSYREEAAWLSGRGPAPTRLHGTQARGLAAALAAPAQATAAPGGAFLQASTVALATRGLYREGDPRLGMDSSSMDHYSSCPYAYLYLRLLGAEPEPSGIAFADAIFIGEAYHAALGLLFERIGEADGSFRPERAEAYRLLVGDCLDEAFSRLASRRGAFVGVVLEAYKGRLERYVENLVKVEAERFPSLEIVSIERELERDYPGLAGGVALRGRIDRISRSERGAVVVDYKKGAFPSKARVAPDGAGAIAEAQIPCYLRLAGAAMAIDSAWYVSIEGDAKREAGAAACAFGADKSAYVPLEGLEPFLEAFDRALAETVDGILAGSFPLAPKESQKTACANCGARGICRERYALRFAAGAEGRGA